MTDYVVMKDSSTAPSFGQAQQFAADGVAVWGLYLGGVRTPHAYTVQEVAHLRAGGIHNYVGFWVAPLRKYGQAFTYVLGVSEGLAACRSAELLGFTAAELAISPDVEDNAVGADVDDYCRGFRDAVRSQTTAALVGYANPGTIKSGAFSGYDGVIVADYLDPPATSPYDTRLGLDYAWFPGRRGVQTVGTHDEHGLGVDTSYLDPWYASNATGGDVPMDQNQLASWMVDIQAQIAELAGALAHNRPIAGSTLYYAATDPGGHSTQVGGMKADPETTGYSMFTAISGTDKTSTYPLPVGQPGPQGPQGPPGAAGGVHHHGVTVDITGAVTGTGTGTTSDPI